MTSTPALSNPVYSQGGVESSTDGQLVRIRAGSWSYRHEGGNGEFHAEIALTFRVTRDAATMADSLARQRFDPRRVAGALADRARGLWLRGEKISAAELAADLNRSDDCITVDVI